MTGPPRDEGDRTSVVAAEPEHGNAGLRPPNPAQCDRTAPAPGGGQAGGDGVAATVDAAPFRQLDAELAADARQREVELADDIVGHRSRVSTTVDHVDQIGEGAVETTAGPLRFGPEPFGVGDVVVDRSLDGRTDNAGKCRLRVREPAPARRRRDAAGRRRSG